MSGALPLHVAFENERGVCDEAIIKLIVAYSDAVSAQVLIESDSNNFLAS